MAATDVISMVGVANEFTRAGTGLEGLNMCVLTLTDTDLVHSQIVQDCHKMLDSYNSLPRVEPDEGPIQMGHTQ